MGRTKIEKLESLIEENRDNNYIFNYVKEQSNLIDFFCCILNVLYKYLCEKKDANTIDKVANLLYKVFSECNIKLSDVSKGNLYCLSKLYKIYTDYINENNLDTNEDTMQKIIEISVKIEEKFDVEENPSYKLYFKLEGIDSNLNDLSNNVSKLLRKYQKKMKEKSYNVIDARELLDKIGTSIEHINKEILHIQSEALKLSVDEELIKFFDSIVSKLFSIKGDYKILCSTVDSYNSLKDSIVVIEERNDNFRKLVIDKLCEQSCTLDQLHEYLTSQKIFMLKDELYRRLMILNNDINIVDESKMGLPTYFKLSEPKYDTGRVFKIGVPSYMKEMDLLLISDLHIGNVGDSVFNVLNNVYDYCINNGITTIINLGDICSLSSSSLSKRDILTEAEKLMDDILLKYPKDQSITNLLMGGNHDKGLFAAGIDPVRQLADLRYDFRNLGYDDAFIDIGTNEVSNVIALHHPNQRVGDETGVLAEQVDIKKILKKIYEVIENGKDNNLVDFFGHFHKSMLDTTSGICIVPSLTKDRFLNAAWHIKLYFDKDKNVNYMIFMPILSIDNRLIRSQEIIYQKKYK